MSTKTIKYDREATKMPHGGPRDILEPSGENIVQYVLIIFAQKKVFIISKFPLDRPRHCDYPELILLAGDKPSIMSAAGRLVKLPISRVTWFKTQAMPNRKTIGHNFIISGPKNDEYYESKCRPKDYEIWSGDPENAPRMPQGHCGAPRWKICFEICS